MLSHKNNFLDSSILTLESEDRIRLRDLNMGMNSCSDGACYILGVLSYFSWPLP